MESKLVPGMGSTVDNVECRRREDEGRFDACKVCKVLVEGNAFLGGARLRYSNRNPKDGVGAKFALVRGAVELDEEVVYLSLGRDGQARCDELGADYIVDVSNSLGDT